MKLKCINGNEDFDNTTSCGEEECTLLGAENKKLDGKEKEAI
jgi:hypothetical protein